MSEYRELFYTISRSMCTYVASISAMSLNDIHDTYLTGGSLGDAAYNPLYPFNPHLKLHHVARSTIWDFELDSMHRKVDSRLEKNTRETHSLVLSLFTRSDYITSYVIIHTSHIHAHTHIIYKI